MVSERLMVHHGRDRMQIGRWKSRSDIANFVPFPSGDTLPLDAVRHATVQAVSAGFREAYTAALAPSQAAPFVASGFELHEELHLLRCHITAEPERERTATRRGRKQDWPSVLELDHLAFDDFWQFDREGLADAIAATPRHRFHVTKAEPVAGYHVTGLGGRNAYVQRVAVHPEAQGQGWGRRLVNDSLWWSWRHGATTSLVNTQLTNDRAVALYERCGFALATDRLQVLHARLA